MRLHPAVTWETLFEEIRDDEGTGPHEDDRFYPYTDSTGHITIGWGRNLSERGISTAEAAMFLQHDISDAVREVEELLPWADQLDEIRWRALVDLVYNLGVEQLRVDFHPTLDHIEHGQWPEVAAHLRGTLWARQTGRRAVRVIAMLETGIDPGPQP